MQNILKVEYSYKMLKKLEAMREELYGPNGKQEGGEEPLEKEKAWAYKTQPKPLNSDLNCY